MVKNVLMSLLGLVVFGVLFFVGAFGATSLLCLNSRDGDGCGDAILILAPVAIIVSAILTIFLMKHLYARLQNNGNHEFVADDGLTPKKIGNKKSIIVALLAGFLVLIISPFILQILFSFFLGGILLGHSSTLGVMFIQILPIFLAILAVAFYLNKK